MGQHAQQVHAHHASQDLASLPERALPVHPIIGVMVQDHAIMSVFSTATQSTQVMDHALRVHLDTGTMQPLGNVSHAHQEHGALVVYNAMNVSLEGKEQDLAALLVIRAMATITWITFVRHVQHSHTPEVLLCANNVLGALNAIKQTDIARVAIQGLGLILDLAPNAAPISGAMEQPRAML